MTEAAAGQTSENTSTTELPESQNNQQTQDQTTQTPPVGSGTEGQFRHEMLKDKTPEQIEQAFRIMESTVRDQGRRLTEQHNQQQSVPSIREAPAGTEVLPSSTEFFADPAKVMRDMINQAVAPLRDQVSNAVRQVQAPDIRGKLKAKYPHFDVLSPSIDHILQQRGIDPTTASEEILETVYFTAKGYAIENGHLSQESARPAVNQPTNENRQQAPAPPQHRPSTAPVPVPQQQQNKQRELTENERILARIQFPGRTDADAFSQYLKWQEMEQEDVPVANFDQAKV